MKLELKHIAGYLPYDLKTINIDNSEIMQLGGLSGDTAELLQLKGIGTDEEYCRLSGFDEFKPILRPLSNLTKEIEHEGTKFIPVDEFEITDDFDSFHVEFNHGNIKLIQDLRDISNNDIQHDIQFLPNLIVDYLLSWHFDIHGLIKKGLAIDKNTLP